MDNNKKRRKKGYKLSFILLIVLMAITFYIIFNEFDFGEVYGNIMKSDNKFFLLISGVLAIVYLCAYGRFVTLTVKSYNEKTTNYNGFVYGCTDFFYSAITPSSTGGQPAVIYFMAKDGLSYSVSAIAVILQTIVFKIVLLLYGLLSLVLIKDILSQSSTILMILLVIGVFLTFVMIVAGLMSMFFKRFSFALGKATILLFGKLHLIKNPKDRLTSYQKTLDEYEGAALALKNQKGLILRLFLITFLQRTAMFGVAYFVYKSFGLSQYNFFQIVAVQAIIALSIDSVPLPGGMGANELAMYSINSNIYPSEVTAAAAMLLTRVFSYYLPLVISSIVTLTRQAKMHFKKSKPIL